jgi:hypothetical protein
MWPAIINFTSPTVLVPNPPSYVNTTSFDGPALTLPVLLPAAISPAIQAFANAATLGHPGPFTVGALPLSFTPIFEHTAAAADNAITAIPRPGGNFALSFFTGTAAGGQTFVSDDPVTHRQFAPYILGSSVFIFIEDVMGPGFVPSLTVDYDFNDFGVQVVLPPIPPDDPGEIPEPTTMWLLGSGLCGIGLLRFVKR